MSSTRAVTIAGPGEQASITVPADTPIRELLPTFAELGAGGPAAPWEEQPVWAIQRDGGPPMPEGKTLAECGVADGDVLTLTQLRSSAAAPPEPTRRRHKEVEPAPRERGDKHWTPRQRVLRSLPERLNAWQRFTAAVAAFFGQNRPPIDPPDTEPEGRTDRQRLTKAEEPGPADRWRASRHETEYLGRLDRQVRVPLLTQCATIAIVSPKGGVGKTTTTALLGSLLASLRNDRTVAIDTNPDYGSLGRTLTPEHETFVDDVLDVLGEPDLPVTELDRHLGRGPDGLMVLPAPTQPERMAKLDEAAYRTLIEQLKALVGTIVLDCGTGLQEPAAKAALSAATQIVVVTDAHPSTASLVAEAYRDLKALDTPVTLVVNKMPPPKQTRIDLDGLEQLIPEARGLVVVPEDTRAAATVAEGSFTWRTAPEAWQVAVRELAVSLTSEWTALGLARDR